jgi:DNA invertase Pin-like site-specific DNA recombinase
MQHTALSVLGLKGTMSEAELHILRARLDGGIRNKAARGELRRGLPVDSSIFIRRQKYFNKRAGTSGGL